LQKISTGCRGIDQSLMGGLDVASLTLVYGEAETGKTTLAMQCSANCAKNGYKTMFIDSERTFSNRRLSQIARDNYNEISELIILARPGDFREQTALVDHLTDYLNRNFKLVVFDTITSLYRLRIAESPSKTFELNRELNRQLAVLAQTAKTQKIVVLLTSQVHAVFNESPISVEPVATRVLKFWANTVLALKLTDNPTIIRAEVEKNPVKLPSATYELRIEKTGVHDNLFH
jgi:RecA/RadA recombinase